MREEPNKLVRILVPVVLFVGLGGAVVASFMFGGQKPAASTTGTDAASAQTAPAESPGTGTPSTTQPAGTAASATNPAAPVTPAAPAAAPPAAPDTASTASPTPTIAPLTGLRALEYPREALTNLGSSVPGGPGPTKAVGYEMELVFSHTGAGVKELLLANHFGHADAKTHEALQRFAPSAAAPKDSGIGITPFAAEAVSINGQRVTLSLNLQDLGKTFWKQTAPGVFEASIVDGAGTPVAKVTRRYELAQGAYEFTIRQSVENLTGAPMKVRWEQFGPADPPLGPIRYGGDTRHLRFGYLYDANVDSSRTTYADGFNLTHHEILGDAKINPATGLPYWDAAIKWPNDRSRKDNLSLVWAAMTGRYFAVSMHAAAPASGTTAAATALVGDAKKLTTVETVERFVVPNGNPAKSDFMTGIVNFVLGRQRLPAGVAVLKTISPEFAVAPGASADLSHAVYAGPIYDNAIKAEPAAVAVGLREIISYSFGGPCAFCTFQTLTHLLLDFLSVLRAYVTHDWALAIMLLVVCVRTILHPVTRWSQVSMLRFGKQMQRVGPKMKAVQEKYKGDPTRLREEVAKLHREEGINYAGMLGCLPMFLQTPVWIALSAMLFFAFELRHQQAFFGLFQSLSGGSWLFLADLAEPDNLIGFGTEVRVPLLSSFMGPVTGLNILPLMMGVLFFIQQKYMTPPQAPGTLSPEMEQQMKIQKVLMVVMFPVFMYNAPSGLALYFLTNSTLGIFESKWIRAHVDKTELERKPTTGQKVGWMERLQQRIADAQRIREQQMKMMQTQKKGKR